MERGQPFFSIIIPTRNRPRQLTQCLAALASLDYPRARFEVIVVNDGSKTSPEHIVNPFRQCLDVKLLTQRHAGPAMARNTGAREARGDFLAFTDDDCAPAWDWLQALSARFARTPDCIVGGQTINGLPENLCSTTSQVLIDYLYDYYNAASSNLSFFASNNLAIPAEQFRRVGGFDGTFPGAAAEDREFCDHCRHHGIEMAYAPEAVVYHMHALTLRGFCQQHFFYGRGAFHFHEMRSRRKPDPIKLEPLKFYLNLLRYPLRQPQIRRPLLIAALLVLSQLATGAGFFRERMSRPASVAPTRQTTGRISSSSPRLRP